MFHIMNRIKVKITLTTMVVVLLALCTSSFSIYLYIHNIISKQIIRDNTAVVSRLAQQVSYHIEDVMKYSRNIILNDWVQYYLKQKVTLEGYDYFSNIQKLEDTLREYVILQDIIIAGIYIIDKDGQVMAIDGLYNPPSKEEWYQRLEEKQNSTFSKPHYIMKSSGMKKEKVISYITKIYDKSNTDTYLGDLIIDFKYDVIIKLFNNSASMKYYLLFDQNNYLIYKSEALDDKDIQQITAVLNDQQSLVDEKDNYFILQTISANGWTIVGVLPKKMIFEDLKYISYIFIIITLSCLIVMTIMSFSLIHNITRPLMMLISGMKKVSSGKLDTKVEIHSGDEIEELANVFNKMVKDIKIHMEESVLKEKREREMEMRLFMAKINPHFIYNTLNTIIYLGRKIHAQDIISFTKSFITILQHTIRVKPYELTTIEKEVEYINNYISILKYRYNDLVELVWDVEPEILKYKIHQMLIYPLVENSVFHGILPKSRKGRIYIRICRKQEYLGICIEDDGIGIQPDMLERIENLMKDDKWGEKSEHIGLSNVNGRLRLLYGQQCSLDIKSVYNQGTSIRFYIPADIMGKAI